MIQSPACSPEGILQRLRCFHLTPNKALGQNFLADASVQAAMLEAAQPDGRPVLEIGPGLGALTEPLSTRAAGVVAVEKDAAMVRLLHETLGSSPRTHILCDDFLQTDLSAVYRLLDTQAPILAIGNLPYYITTPILMRLFLADIPIQTIVVMVQQDAAVRFFAKPGDRVYGPLSVLAQLNYRIVRVRELDPSCFFPQPGVRSSVVALHKKESVGNDAADFAAFLKHAFHMRRKTLANNLCTEYACPRSDVAQLLHTLEHPADVRAEALSPDALYALYRHFSAAFSAGASPDPTDT